MDRVTFSPKRENDVAVGTENNQTFNFNPVE